MIGSAIAAYDKLHPKKTTEEIGLALGIPADYNYPNVDWDDEKMKQEFFEERDDLLSEQHERMLLCSYDKSLIESPN